MLPLPLPEMLVAAAIVAVGAALQGSIGFGLALVAAPLLVLIDPVLVPAPLIANAWVLVLLVVIREHRHVDLAGVRWGIAGYVVGAALAAAVLTRISAHGFSLLFGTLVLIGVGLSGLGLRVIPTPKHVLGAGLLGGFMGTTSSIGGPPMALVYQDAAGARFRGTLSTYFLCTSWIALTLLAAIGRFGARELSLALGLLPGLLLGFVVSGWGAQRLDGVGIRPLVLGLSGLAGAVVLIRALV